MKFVQTVFNKFNLGTWKLKECKLNLRKFQDFLESKIQTANPIKIQVFTQHFLSFSLNLTNHRFTTHFHALQRLFFHPEILQKRQRKLLTGTRKSFPYQSHKELISYSPFFPLPIRSSFAGKTILLWKHNRKYLVTCTQKTFNALFHPRLAESSAFALCLNSICTWMKSCRNKTSKA
jgi:hypothetical protein